MPQREAHDAKAVRVLFLFVDGIGLGPSDETFNPLAVNRPGFLALSRGVPWTVGARSATDDHVFVPVDARLGVDGYPQSGTGQATLFTGVNCAALAGRHFGPWPHSSSRPVIRKHSLFARIGYHAGIDACAFANAYPPRFFELMRQRDRWPVTTRACLDAGVRIRTMDDLGTGRAIAADLSGKGLLDLGLEVSVRTPRESAGIVLDLSSRHLFTLVEVFHTDKAGHARNRDRAETVLRDVDRFLEAIVHGRPDGTLVVLTSDHGNLEDLRFRTHTLNDVPLVALGPGARAFATVRDLAGVVPAVLRALGMPVGQFEAAASASDSDA